MHAPLQPRKAVELTFEGNNLSIHDESLLLLDRQGLHQLRILDIDFLAVPRSEPNRIFVPEGMGTGLTFARLLSQRKERLSVIARSRLPDHHENGWGPEPARSHRLNAGS
jgi:hypothetical protein